MTAITRFGLDLKGLDTVRSLMPDGVELDEIDLSNEDEFVQIGAILVAHINLAWIAIGELLDWKMRMERAESDVSRDVVFKRYANAWNTSHTSLVRAWVLATKFPQVDRPEDIPHTTAYEILAHSDTEEDARLGFGAVTENDLRVADVREAAALQRDGYQERGDWTLPTLYYKGDEIWGRTSNGYEVMVWTPVRYDDPQLREVAERVKALAKRRMRGQEEM